MDNWQFIQGKREQIFCSKTTFYTTFWVLFLWALFGIRQWFSNISELLTPPPRNNLISQGTEYCFNEEFAATCPAGQEVRVRWALLGRMISGRCITDTDNLDCYNDISEHMRGECRDKRDCRVNVGTLGKMSTSCPTNMMFYLHADYDCIDGKSLWRKVGWIPRIDGKSLSWGNKM